MADMNRITDGVLRAFQDVPGIDSIVLGDSHATGTASTASDVDIGIYYDEPSFDLGLFKRRACPLDDGHRENAITDIGDWGPWINGGWLKVDGTDVDILFRDTRKVSATVDTCLSGGIAIDHQCGHPFGFANSIYMGEVAHGKELYAANSRVKGQKKRLSPFPETYRKAAMATFLWEGSFSLFCGRKAIGKRDVIYALPLSLRHVPAACLVCRKRYVHAQ